jgi:hypothetical protein
MTSAPIPPTAEQEQRAKWDLLLLDIETRNEQLRQLRVFESRRLTFQLLGAVAALLLAGAAFAGSVLAVSSWIARQPQTINVHLDAPLTIAPK